MEGVFYVNDSLEKLMFEELRNACRGGGSRYSSAFTAAGLVLLSYLIVSSGVGGFLPAMKQIGNVAALPGIIHVSVHMKGSWLLGVLLLNGRTCCVFTLRGPSVSQMSTLDMDLPLETWQPSTWMTLKLWCLQV